MPRYRFQCEACGLQFEARNKASKAMEPKPCLGCDTPSQRMMPETVSGQFNQKVTGMPVPQNTGVASFDTKWDRVVGQHAAKGHAVIEARQKDKREMLRDNPDATGDDIQRTADGQYRVLPKTERESAHKRLRIAKKTRFPTSKDH